MGCANGLICRSHFTWHATSPSFCLSWAYFLVFLHHWPLVYSSLKIPFLIFTPFYSLAFLLPLAVFVFPSHNIFLHDLRYLDHLRLRLRAFQYTVSHRRIFLEIIPSQCNLTFFCCDTLLYHLRVFVPRRALLHTSPDYTLSSLSTDQLLYI